MSTRNNRLTLDVDTTLAPIASGGTGTFTVKGPPCANLLRFKAAQLAGDATSFDWKIRATSSADAVDKLAYEFDKAAGATSTNGTFTVSKTYSEGASSWQTEAGGSVCVIEITSNAGVAGGNTYRFILTWELRDGTQHDVAIPAP